jgi:Uma2 family endonuclease
MATATQFMTAEELARLPNKDKRYALVRGELRTMPPTGIEHGMIESNVHLRLGFHVKDNQLGVIVIGDTGFLLARDPDTVLAADLAFVAKARFDQIGITKKYWPGAPDLAVEIISPNDTYYEVDEKVQTWLDGGTKVVWVINPRRRTVIVYTAHSKPLIQTATDVLDGQDVVPGFQVPVAELFPQS